MTFVQPPVNATPATGAPPRSSGRARLPLVVLGFALLLARPQAGAAHVSLVDWFDQASVEAALVPVSPWPLPARVAELAAASAATAADGPSDPVPTSMIDIELVGAALAPIAHLDSGAMPDRPMQIAAAGDAAAGGCPTLLRHSYQRLQGGQTQSLCDYRGQVVLVVNTASYCGYTNQYEGLEALYRKYRDRGLVVVGFPSNDFGGQEPGTNQEIAEFCRSTYGVQFPMFEKSSVTGVANNPLFVELAARTGERPQWNFHKYVIDRRGEKVASFRSAVAPDSRELVGTIERLLAQPAGTSRG